VLVEYSNINILLLESSWPDQINVYKETVSEITVFSVDTGDRVDVDNNHAINSNANVFSQIDINRFEGIYNCCVLQCECNIQVYIYGVRISACALVYLSRVA